jgi:hypothetical protein
VGGYVKLENVAFQVSAPTVPRVEATRNKLSTPWRPMATASDAYRSLLLVGLASLGDATATPRWTAGELRLLAEERPGAGGKHVGLGLDKLATRRVEVVRTRLSTRSRWITTAATLRTLVLVGLDYTERLPIEDLSGRLARFLTAVNARIEALAAEQGRTPVTMFAMTVRSRVAVAEGREGGHGA